VAVSANCRMMVPSPHQVHDPSQDGHGEADVIGRKLLHYEVVARLGAGGMGEVWRAYDPRLEREVAIKVLPSGSGEESPHRERFVREARAASALAHPNIITIHEINTADGLDFIVMEYVRGEPLSDVLSGGALSAVRAVEYTLQVADALKAAHEAGIVHRDLKPSNIMIGSSGSVKVLDFGIAKRVSDRDAGGDRTTSAPLTMMGQTIGTPAYMSPEQTLGDIVDARSDLFSLGVVLYEMLSGQRPFQSPTNLGLVRKIVHEPQRPLREVAPHVPSALVAIVDRCLVKDPAGRYASAAMLRDDLRRCAARLPASDSEPSEAVTGPAAPPALAAPRRRVPARAAAIAAAVLVIGGVSWAGAPSVLRWLRTPAQADLADAQASPQELYTRAADALRVPYREGNVDRAIDQLNRALALKSPYPIAEARLSLAYWRKNNYNADSEWQKRALAHAERAVAGDEQLALGHIALGAALMLTGNLEKAEAAYRKAETLEPRNWELSWRLGALAVARKDNAAAEQHYRRAVEAAPGEWESHSHLGAFLYRQARYAEAIASFDEMRGLAPDQTRAYSNLAAAYHQLGRTDEAAAVLQRALEIAPDSLTYSNLGTYLYFQGKYPEAEHAFDTAVKLNANAYQRWGNLGDAVRMTAPGSEKMHQSYRRAIQLAEAELAKRQSNPSVRSSLAVYLIRDAQPERALAEIDQVLSQTDLPPQVLFNAALVVELADQRRRSMALLARALAAGYRLREISAEPDLVKLRADPEYHKLASRYEK
jgi:eukaryotic-like serine/threonine-protein kinase